MDFNFRMLTFKMLRRISELAYFYAPDQTICWDFNELLRLAGSVQITDKQLQWIESERYSRRQKTSITMGGFSGHLTLQGDLQPFNELLRMSEIFHVGKGSVFGLGKIKIKTVQQEIR